MSVQLFIDLVMIVLLADLVLTPIAAVALIAGIAFAPEPLGTWCKGVFRAGDYLVAALLGGDGKHSVSAYCGLWQAVLMDGLRYGRAEQLAALVCGGVLRWAIDKVFGEGHCAGAARKEGLLA